ncbi:hypothetical protein [Sediminibacterium ginsengisoli]|uniref:Lipoprotein n=1 Tax=Sediminibacterium ginsengisoli TaxID=413434 RepID=A0A1T4QQK0_9BACT|nr:hypothetical protein [Sediminibacterium ginsengisoli]SKA05887.1 hypothetical protein SAMN04488132_10933 [Sediminibacterium ginsengisoli]
MRKICLPLFFLLASCATGKRVLNVKPAGAGLSGTAFYNLAASWKWKQRDSLAVKEILSGNYPSFLQQFARIDVEIDGTEGKKIKAHYYVAPDYLAVGNSKDWARIPLTPMAAQVIADSFHCFLPTRKIVDDIYRQAVVKLDPVPMYAFRDSSVTMWQHHLIIEGQRGGRKGLIAGIKKDVVLSGKVSRDARPDREAIYGWHKPDGKAIQPLYTGHINWWVDYSHGIRLVYRTIWVNGKPMDYTDVLKDPSLRGLLCDEGEGCDFYRY